jgi:hypothetical protein
MSSICLKYASSHVYLSIICPFKLLANDFYYVHINTLGKYLATNIYNLYLNTR